MSKIRLTIDTTPNPDWIETEDGYDTLAYELYTYMRYHRKNDVVSLDVEYDNDDIFAFIEDNADLCMRTLLALKREMDKKS